jgi:hypothetical protein
MYVHERTRLNVSALGASHGIELAVITDSSAASPPLPPEPVGQPCCPLPYPGLLLFGQSLHSGSGEVLSDFPSYSTVYVASLSHFCFLLDSNPHVDRGARSYMAVKRFGTHCGDTLHCVWTLERTANYLGIYRWAERADDRFNRVLLIGIEGGKSRLVAFEKSPA